MSDLVKRRRSKSRPLDWHPVATVAYTVKADRHTPDECERAYLDMQAARSAPLFRQIDELKRSRRQWRAVAWVSAALWNAAAILELLR